MAIFSTFTSTTFGVVFLSSISLPTVISQMEPKIKINSVLIPEYKLFRLLHFNIRSLKCHYDELLLFLSSLKVEPTVIALTETWLNDLDHIDSLSFPGFSKLITKNRRTRGGGIGLLVSECTSTVIEDSTGDANIIQSSALSKSYLDVISSHNFQQVIQNPTRVTKNSSSLLDHINEYPIFKYKKFRKNRVLYKRSFPCLR